MDGIYSSDPNITTMAKKLDEISFDEMQEIADAGAKVLHNRCIQIGKKFNCDIEAKSTFVDKRGTRICKEIENTEIKSIVKNDNLIKIKVQGEKENNINLSYKIYKDLLEKNIIAEYFDKNSSDFSAEFRIQKAELNKVQEILEENYSEYNISQEEIIKLTIVGYGIIQDNIVLQKVIKILEENKIIIQNINLTQSKIEVIVDKMDDELINKIHNELI